MTNKRWIMSAAAAAFICGSVFFGFYCERLSQTAYSDFLGELNNGHVRSAVIQGYILSGQLSDGSDFKVHIPKNANLIDR